MNLRRMGTVRDRSSWRACGDDPNVTLYSKRVDFDIRMPVGPTIMMQVIHEISNLARSSNSRRPQEEKWAFDFAGNQFGFGPTSR